MNKIIPRYRGAVIMLAVSLFLIFAFSLLKIRHAGESITPWLLGASTLAMVISVIWTFILIVTRPEADRRASVNS